MSKVILEVKSLKKYFPVTKGIIFMKQMGAIKAVDGIDFVINQGETLGLVGESGCGKTTTTRLILLLEKITSGSIFFRGRDISTLTVSEIKTYRSSVQPVFQDPYSSLSPRLKVKDIIAEPIVENKVMPPTDIPQRVEDLLEMVGLNRHAGNFYPHEFSGGQRQRIAVARAISIFPSLVVLDEPVSALDVSIQAQIMNLLRKIQKQLNLTYLLVAHDLAVIRHMSDSIVVMYLGKIVERGDSESIYTHPAHPYTKALLSAALPSHPDASRKEIILSGEVPSPLNPPTGCRFHTRCMDVMPICSKEEPVMKSIHTDHMVACHCG